MIIRVPSYYGEFFCIADRCQDTCCVGWEIDIDPDTAAYYRAMEGDLGDRLRRNMTRGEFPSFRLKKGKRCPMLNEKNLCDIVLEKGETSLCEVCSEYPRFTLTYGDVVEKCLAISCEEVGRILFETTEPVTFPERQLEETAEAWEDPAEECLDPEEPDSEEPFPKELDSEEPEVSEYEYEEDPYEEDPYERDCRVGSYLSRARDHMITLLQDRTRPMEDRICGVLAFAEKVQEIYNTEDWGRLESLLLAEPMEHLPEALEPESGWEERQEILEGLEILDDEWKSVFDHMKQVFRDSTEEENRRRNREFMAFYRSREQEYEQLLVYLIFRYVMKSVFDNQFRGQVQMAVFSFLTIRDMDAIRFADQGGCFSLADRIDNCRIYSKEVEHSEDNLEYLQEEFLYRENIDRDHLCAQVRFL